LGLSQQQGLPLGLFAPLIPFFLQILDGAFLILP
jgi:hypothetical protein